MAFNLVHYSQQDPQWKNNTIGGGPDTIGYIGCALTCVAMYSSGWGFTETPATLNKKLTANGGYVDEAIVWGAISKFYPKIKSTGLTICKTNTDAPISQIDAYMAAGQPVIVEVDFSPSAGLQTHWVVLYAKQGNDYLMLDPWPYPTDTQAVTLMSRFSHGQTLARTIKAIAWYQYSASTPAPGGSTGGSDTDYSTARPGSDRPGHPSDSHCNGRNQTPYTGLAGFHCKLCRTARGPVERHRSQSGRANKDRPEQSVDLRARPTGTPGICRGVAGSKCGDYAINANTDTTTCPHASVYTYYHPQARSRPTW
jgi:hypothetical protein